jgi:hypothetical protein
MGYLHYSVFPSTPSSSPTKKRKNKKKRKRKKKRRTPPNALCFKPSLPSQYFSVDKLFLVK